MIASSNRLVKVTNFIFQAIPVTMFMISFLREKLMKKIFVSVILIITISTLFLLPGCSRVGSAMNGSGKIIDKGINISDFTDVNISGPFTVEIYQSNNYNVILSTDDNLFSRVIVSLEDKTLKLSIQAPSSFFPTILNMKIGMPVIKSTILNNEAKASLSGFARVAGFHLILKQASSINGYLEAENIDFNLSGGSQAVLKGLADRLQLECSGESTLDLTDLYLSSANVRVIDASTAILNVDGRFDVVLDGASKILYLGNPVFSNTSISGGSTMSRK
jgi:hypothetical protein